MLFPVVSFRIFGIDDFMDRYCTVPSVVVMVRTPKLGVVGTPMMGLACLIFSSPELATLQLFIW